MKYMIFLLVFFVGCVGTIEKDAIKAEVQSQLEVALASIDLKVNVTSQLEGRIEASVKKHIEKTINQKSGDQTAGDKSLNVGQVSIDGGSAVLGALVFLVSIGGLIWYLNRKKKQAIKTVDTIVESIEESLYQGDLKELVESKAIERGVEPFLHSRVEKAFPKKGK